MEGFRKQYEYEEEQSLGGLLMVFFVMLVTAELFLGIITLIEGSAALKGSGFFSSVFLASGTVYMLFSLLTAVVLYKKKRFAIKLAKFFLLFRVIYLSISNILIFLDLYHDPSTVGSGGSQYQSVSELVISCLVFPMLYAWGFSVLWNLYLNKSKRVRETFPA